MTGKNTFFVCFLYIFVNIPLIILTQANQHNNTDIKLPKPTHDLPKAVEDFNAAFRNEVRQSKYLTRLFDIGDQVTPSEIRIGNLYLTMAMSADFGNKNAVADSILLIRYIHAYPKKLVDDVLIDVYSSSIAKSLHKLKALDEQNSENLAKSYAKVMENAYKKVANEKYPRSKVAALTVGFFTFVTNQFEVTDTVKNTFIEAYANEWRNQFRLGNFPDAKEEIPPLRSPAVNPLLKPDAKACKDSEAVRKFHQVFSHAVQSSPTLSELFEPLPLEDIFKGNYYAHIYFLQRYGVEDAAILADFISRYIDEKNTRNQSVLLSVLCKSRAKYLQSEGVLNSINAESLALRYARILEDAAKLMFIKEYPRAKIVVGSFGSLKFLKELDAFDSRRGKKYAFFLGNEWKCRM